MTTKSKAAPEDAPAGETDVNAVTSDETQPALNEDGTPDLGKGGRVVRLDDPESGQTARYALVVDSKHVVDLPAVREHQLPVYEV